MFNPRKSHRTVTTACSKGNWSATSFMIQMPFAVFKCKDKKNLWNDKILIIVFVKKALDNALCYVL